MTLDSILSIVKKIIDICIVWVILYYLLRSIRKNVKLSMLVKGIIVVVIIKLISDYFGLVTIGLLFEYIITWGPLAIIIIFQPEIRNTLEQLGKTNLLGRHKTLSVNERERVISELGITLDYLRKNRIGALIVFERDTSLSSYIEKAKIYSEFKQKYKSRSYCEQEIVDYIKSIYNGEIITNSRSIIKPYELDIYLPNVTVAIEENDTFWHSNNPFSRINDYNKYHRDKQELCNKQGITLLYINRKDWLNNNDICKKQIKDIIGSHT